jgi:2-keto-4-pentenoate hydratase/2-oxohepta-3-ene-1,7-dioic acid hydratase in catechol pathway
MRLCRFDGNRLGIFQAGKIIEVSSVVDVLLPSRWPTPPGDPVIANLDLLTPLIREAAGRPGARAVPLDEVAFDSPVATPAHIIAAPLNYPLHVHESHDPAINHGVHMPTHEGFETPIDKYGLFLKSQTGLVGPAQGVELHWPGRRNDHEVELAVIIGKGGKRIRAEDAMAHVAGYSIGLDITVRGPEDRSFRKSADTYSVLGPWLVTADEIPDPGSLDLALTVDGRPRQRSNTRHLIVKIPDLIRRASAVYELFPGDIIMTGTPDGVGEIPPGCEIHAWIERIGDMKVKVR